MKWASAIAKDLDLHQALMSLARSIEEQLEESDPNLVLVFVSPHHASEYIIIPRFLTIVIRMQWWSAVQAAVLLVDIWSWNGNRNFRFGGVLT